MKLPAACLAVLCLASAPAAEEPPTPADPAEVEVIEYLREHVKPGQPVVVSDLANRVFTAPAQRAALDRLFGSFFRLPLFVALHQRANGRPPSLTEISGQFRFRVPGQAEVMLRILEADPRLPRFLERDPASGEITSVDVEAILAHPRFGKAVERSLSGWEGRPAPAWEAVGSQGGAAALVGRPHLVYFWFSGCPPCVRTSPLLAPLRDRFAEQGFEIVAVNADAVLEVPVDAAQRAAYARRHGWRFPMVEATERTLAAFGSIDVFPTFVFVDRQGLVVRQLVNFQEPATLEAAAALAVR